MQQLMDGQEYTWARERAARDTNESTNSRVMWWTFMEMAAVIALSVAQVVSIRQFFSKNVGPGI